MPNDRRPPLGLALLAVGLLAAPALADLVPEPPMTATPRADCGPGSRPEPGIQGRVSREDMESGRAAEGFTCNTEMLGHHRSAVIPANTWGTIAGYKVHRYVDTAGNECAYYDSTLLFPTNVGDQEGGVVVLDMADPTNPVHTMKLVTPGMVSMHESLVISEERGILAGISAAAEPIELPAFLDLYDLTEDCRQPRLLSSTPMPLLAHESGFSPDGKVFWANMTNEDNIWAIDVSDPQLPTLIYHARLNSHGINIRADGSRSYLSQTGDDRGLLILDTAELNEYLGSSPEVLYDLSVPIGMLEGRPESGVPGTRPIAKLEWTGGSIPQNAVPFTSGGRHYLMEVDEFGGCSGTPKDAGAARIIDIEDETKPFVLSNLRLEVHNPEFFDEVCDDPGAPNPLQTYSAHYCSIPTRVDPTIVACGMNLSGLRIFDISDPANPIEAAYFNAPVQPRPLFDNVPQDTLPYGITLEASNWAMSAPAFVPERKEVWYSDAFQGFYAVRVTNGAWPDAVAAAPSDPAPPPPAPAPLPVTGAAQGLQALGVALLLGAVDIHRRRRREARAPG